MLYLDNAATTPIRPEVRASMAPYLDEIFGNPSGVHRTSQRAKNALEDAREQAAELLGATRPLEIVFTGGGTESDNLGVIGAALGRPSRRGVVTTAIEHEAVLESAAYLARLGAATEIVGVDRSGLVDPSAVAAVVGPSVGVVSVMAANNETGVLQDLAAVVEHVRGVDSEILVHTDAVQAFVSEDVTVESTGADLISLASHKLGGPKGVGLLYVRDGVDLEPTVHGGGQELGRRSGTQNVAGIVGMVSAMAAAVDDRKSFRDRIAAARDQFEATLARSVPGLEINAPIERRLVQHAHLRFPGVDAETLLIRLDQAGIAASAGSACHSGAVEVSHVLRAMGMTDEAASQCLRFTFGWTQKAEDGPDAARAVLDVLEEIR